MENEKEMRERHKKELEDLQAQCPHAIVSDWMDYYWASGHYSHQVKVCKNCGKTIASEPNTPESSITVFGSTDYRAKTTGWENK